MLKTPFMFKHLPVLFLSLTGFASASWSGVAQHSSPVYTHSFADDTTGNNEFISPSDNKKYWYIDAQPGDANGGADNYFLNVYERPTIQSFQNKSHPTLGTVWASSEYFPYLDLIGGKLGIDSPFIYVALHLFDTDQNGMLSQEYTIELDVDGDMRGDVLLVADNPGDKNASSNYTQNSLFGFKDNNNDVGGSDPLLSQSNGDLINPGTMNGYETAFFSDANPYFWCRIDTSDASNVEFKIDYVALGNHLGLTISADSMLIKFSGADKGIQDPQKYWFHDKYTLNEAGTPYNDGYTLGNIYEYDNMRVVSMLTSSSCDTFKISNHFSLVFDGVVYDSIAGTSTWTYTLEWDGTPPELSHFIIELCTLLTNANLVDVEPNFGSIGFDGSTGLYGIKWDNIEDFPADTPITFSFTLDQIFPVDHTQFAPKAGVNDNIASICGPALDCQPCDDDNTPPQFVNCPTNFTVQCDAVPAPPVDLMGTDNCDPNPTISYIGEVSSPGGCPQEYFITRRWVITDASGNADTCTQVITVIDTSPPVITCPPNLTFECDNVGSFGFPTATDNCDTSVDIALAVRDSIPGACPQEYVLNLTYIATDDCGNADTCIQNITVQDTTPPVISCPADLTFECDNVGSFGFPTATDNCDTNVDIVLAVRDSIPGACPQEYVLNLTYIATDDCGNADTCTQIITVIDNVPPLPPDCPADITVQCDAIPAPPTVTATDNCDPSPSVVYLGETINNGSCPYTITRKWVAIDACGNVSDTCVQTITVIDTNPPSISCPGPVTVECFADVPAPDVNSVTASDSCGAVTVTFEGDSPSGSCPTIITRTYKATDLCGNFAICTQTITVDDTTAPVLSGCPSNASYQCFVDVPVPANVSANDNCIGAIVPAFTEQQSNPGSSCNNVVTRTWTATDSCGNIATCAQIITVNDTTDPVPIGCPSNAIYQCLNDVPSPENVMFNDNCDSTLTPLFAEQQSNPGSSCNNVITRTWTATDDCGNDAICTQIITVNDTTKPACNVPNDTSIVLCAPGNVCLPVSAVDNCDSSPTCSKLAGPGTYAGGQWCFNASSGNTNVTGIFQCVDVCGNTCVDTVNVHLIVNTAPILTVNVTSPVTVCGNGDTVCVPFNVVDPDNGHTYETLIGWVNSGPKTACFIADTSGNYCNRLIVKDSCELADTVNYCVQVNICTPVSLGADLVYNGFHCDPFCESITPPPITGGCGPYAYYVNNQSANPSTSIQVCIAECQHIDSTLTFIVFDSACGRSDTATINFTGTVNCPPEPSVPAVIADAPICSLGVLVCIPGIGFECMDNDGNATSTLNGQPYTPGDPICFTPNSFGPYTLTLICSDGCASDTDFAMVNIVQGLCPTGCGNVVIEKTHNTIQGQYETVDITVDSMATPIGGFDLLVEYDASALSLSQVMPGSFITNCGWEYFTYRMGGCTNCGSSACPSGAVRIIAIAETNNGPNHPSCFQMEPAQLAVLTFLVTNDRTFECQYVPIRFIWCDCGDNTFSSASGDSLYISEHVYDYYDGINWTEITNPSSPFPSRFGAGAICDIDPGDGKPAPTRCIDFYNGGIDIVCADSIDDRGDINMNGVSNEVADAVLLGNYFIYGLGVFTVNVQGQIAASDVNADGTVLSVADLVYLIRVVIGDVQPYSKVTVPVKVKYTHSADGRLTINDNTQIGAAFVMVRGQIEPVLLANQMEMLYNFDGINTRILLWSTDGDHFTGDFLKLDGEIVSIEMATSQGNPVALNVIPTEFALHQNYPNPFNPKTIISFTLPIATDYSLSIYNVNGQQVASFRGAAENAGSLEIEWDAGNYASGIYLYKLVAGPHVEIKKMILLK